MLSHSEGGLPVERARSSLACYTELMCSKRSARQQNKAVYTSPSPDIPHPTSPQLTPTPRHPTLPTRELYQPALRPPLTLYLTHKTPWSHRPTQQPGS